MHVRLVSSVPLRCADIDRPVRAYWTFPPIMTAKCFNDTTAMETSGVINTLAEFIVAILPLLAVIRLRVDKPWAAVGLLSLGFIVAVVGCIRTYYIFKAYQSNDPTWWSGAQWICSEVENNLALVGCQPNFLESFRH